MTKVAKLRDKVKGNFQAQYGFSLTFLPFVLSATCVALRQFPLLNASIEGTNIIYHRDINLGIAVALENGLIVPVIRNADEKNVIGLQRSIADLAARARSRQLRPDEVQGGTFSITNFGSFGSVFATPGDQSAAGGDSGRRHGGERAGGDRRRDRDPVYCVPGADVRPSFDRRRAGGSVYRQDQSRFLRAGRKKSHKKKSRRQVKAR